MDFFSHEDLRYLFSIGVSFPKWTTGTGNPYLTVNLMAYFGGEGEWFLLEELSATLSMLYTLGVTGFSLSCISFWFKQLIIELRLKIPL